jgi:hypothetical protein
LLTFSGRHRARVSFRLLAEAIERRGDAMDHLAKENSLSYNSVREILLAAYGRVDLVPYISSGSYLAIQDRPDHGLFSGRFWSLAL